MESRKVEVIHFFACDGKEFSNIDECLAYERKVREALEYAIPESRMKIKDLKRKANTYRLQFLVAKCDALDALNDGKMITFHEKMIEYYINKKDYANCKFDLFFERRHLNELINNSCLWFGDRKHKSKLAKSIRRKKSLRWRQENAPDKWRTPNKIRVSKLPKEEQ